jgi:hypothetical protein
MRRAVNSSVARVNGWNGNGHGWTTAALQEDSSVLEAREDEYGGMVVDADRLPHDVAAFARSLTVSLSYWKSVVRHHGRISLLIFSGGCCRAFHNLAGAYITAVVPFLQVKKGVWLKLPLDRSEYIPLAVKVYMSNQ